MASNDPPANRGTPQEEVHNPDVHQQLIQPTLQPNDIAHSAAASSNTSITSTPLQAQSVDARKRTSSSLESTTTTRRTRSQRRTSDKSLSNGPSSIRDGAHNPSKATGSQNSVSSKRSRYNPEYFREQKMRKQAQALQQSQSQSNDEDAVMGHYHNTQDPPDSPNANTAPATIYTGPTPPSQLDTTQNEDAAQAQVEHPTLSQPQPPINDALCRICVCDGPSIPPECVGCNIENLDRCRHHQLRQCENAQCNNMFHVQCLRNLGWLDTDKYECMQCATKSQTDDSPFDELEGIDTREERLLRIGMAYPDTEAGRVAAMKRMKKRIGVMQNEMCQDDVDAILNNTPKAYPSSVRMSDESMAKHIRCGRDFEISVQLHSVNKCDCCGRVQPGHIDPTFPTTTIPFPKAHLTMKYHPAWLCTCDFCKGGQFYSHRRPTILNEYKLRHDSKAPWDVLDLPKDEPNAFICENCHKEVGSQEVEGEYTLFVCLEDVLLFFVLFVFTLTCFFHPVKITKCFFLTLPCISYQISSWVTPFH